MSNILSNLIKESSNKVPIFKNKEIFETTYNPPDIKNRDEQVTEIFRALEPLLKREKPSNVFVYGGTGTGKTLVIDNVCSAIHAEVPNSMEYYIFNCMEGSSILSENALLLKMLKRLGIQKNQGYTNAKLLELFFEELAEKNKNIVLIFDEIDTFLKHRPSFLYSFLRAEELFKSYDSEGKQKDFKCKVTVIGISNTVNFMELIDPRSKSSLNATSVIFKPYNAIELGEILEYRAEKGFIKGVYDNEVILKIGAYVAQDSGDARRAISYLKATGEITFEKGLEKVTPDLIPEAMARSELNRVTDTALVQTKHAKMILYSFLVLQKRVEFNGVLREQEEKFYEEVNSIEIFNKYIKLSKDLMIKPLTDRSFRDHLKNWENLGVLSSKLDYTGAVGKKKMISFNYPEIIRDDLINKLGSDLNIS